MRADPMFQGLCFDSLTFEYNSVARKVLFSAWPERSDLVLNPGRSADLNVEHELNELIDLFDIDFRTSINDSKRVNQCLVGVRVCHLNAWQEIIILHRSPVLTWLKLVVFDLLAYNILGGAVHCNTLNHEVCQNHTVQ